jgi:hypothetical protein
VSLAQRHAALEYSGGGWNVARRTVPGITRDRQNVGWIPPDFVYDTGQIVSSPARRRTRGCATCHVAFTTITDKATGPSSFRRRPPVHADPCTIRRAFRRPTRTALAERDFSGCTISGCHLTRQAAVSAFQAVDARFNNLLDQIWFDTDNDSVIDPTDGGLLPQLLAGHGRRLGRSGFRQAATTVAKGTLWNAALAATNSARISWWRSLGTYLLDHMASGNGVHNPSSSRRCSSRRSALKQTYGASPPNLDLTVRDAASWTAVRTGSR